jgi:hypothetical protein
LTDNSSRKATRKRRKKLRPIDPSNKRIYREHQLMERLLARYTDRERVLNVTRMNSVADLPDDFYAEAEGIPVCRVSVNWLGIKRATSKVIREIAQRAGREAELTPERLERNIDVVASSATLYVFHFMPEVFDLALYRLCHEALMAIPAHKGRHWIKSSAKGLVKRDYEATLRRLEVHEGPRPTFRHRSQYEHALKTAIAEILADGEKITQNSVAGKLGKDQPELIDDRVIRHWNTEFGVNWKGFVKEALKADKS